MALLLAKGTILGLTTLDIQVTQEAIKSSTTHLSPMASNLLMTTKDIQEVMEAILLSTYQR